MVKPNYSYKPKSWVSGYKIQEGNNSDGYPTGGDKVNMRKGGRIGRSSKKINKKRKGK